MKIDDVKVIAVIGAGDMGHGIAEVAIMSSYIVYLYDVNSEFLNRGVNRILKSLEKFVEKGKLPFERVVQVREKLLRPCIDMEEVVSKADIVIEAIPEIFEMKKQLFERLDKLSPSHALLASNTSTMKISDLGKATGRPDKVVGLHYFNPAVLMELVEVVRGDETSDNTMEVAYRFCLKTGKVPVRIEKDTPGFIVNRVQAPRGVLVGCILDEEIAGPEEIDAMMRKEGMPMGPCEIIDYAGIDVHYQARLYFAETLHSDYFPPRVVQEKIRDGDLGKKTGRGFFDWSHGRPVIDLSMGTGKVDPKDLIAVQINEATKLIEGGVCSAEDIDKAIVKGTGNKLGPMTIAKSFAPEDLCRRLETLSNRFGIEIFRPTKMIREGRY